MSSSTNIDGKAKVESVKKCSSCKQTKPESGFHWANKAKGVRSRVCKTCRSKAAKARYGPSVRTAMRNARALLKSEVMEGLGGGHCACVGCDVSNARFLTIDHIVGLEGKPRLDGAKLWYRIKREGFPRHKYQILCFNCNVGRAMNQGVCPHLEGTV